MRRSLSWIGFLRSRGEFALDLLFCCCCFCCCICGFLDIRSSWIDSTFSISMATPFQLPVTAAQVGSFFVGRYYHVLQHQPEFVHQFYNEASTSLRIDGNTRDTATSILHIHALVMSLNYSAIEIKTTHSLESWNGGVLVMVSGSVNVNDYNRRRKFMQTFFLAPQEKGYFVLNDIFHFVEDEQLIQHPVAYLGQGNLNPELSAPTSLLGQASNYVYDGDFQSREYVGPDIEENGLSDDYGFSEERLQNVHEVADKVFEDNYAGQSNGLLHSGMKPLQDHLSIPVDEAIGGGPQKLTYASILAKGQTAHAVSSQSVDKTSASLSEWQNVSDSSGPSSNVVERHAIEPVEEPAEDEVEVKSVYVKNVPTTMSASEIEEEFKKFGKLRPDGVAIRTRKDIDICYAFVEFEDISGVQNAIKASSVEIDGHYLYIEGRRPNRGILIRGRGRGRGRVSYYPMDGARGRFGGRFFGRGNNSQDALNDHHREYNNRAPPPTSRGSNNNNNGFYRQGTRQDY